MAYQTIPARGQDWARVVRARRPVPHRVAHDVLDRLTKQLLDLPPEQARRDRVDEGEAALQIDPINAFTC